MAEHITDKVKFCFSQAPKEVFLTLIKWHTLSTKIMKIHMNEKVFWLVHISPVIYGTQSTVFQSKHCVPNYI